MNNIAYHAGYIYAYLSNTANMPLDISIADMLFIGSIVIGGMVLLNFIA